MIASAVRTMIRFRAVLIAVAIGKSMCGFASALFPVGRTPTVRPPPRLAPFAEASMTPFRPPQIRTASARATRNPTSSARASPSGDAVLPPPITPMINLRAMRESPFKLATELSLCRCQSTFDTFAPDVDGMVPHLVEKSERMLVGRRPYADACNVARGDRDGQRPDARVLRRNRPRPSRLRGGNQVGLDRPSIRRIAANVRDRTVFGACDRGRHAGAAARRTGPCAHRQGADADSRTLQIRGA